MASQCFTSEFSVASQWLLNGFTNGCPRAAQLLPNSFLKPPNALIVLVLVGLVVLDIIVAMVLLSMSNELFAAISVRQIVAAPSFSRLHTGHVSEAMALWSAVHDLTDQLAACGCYDIEEIDRVYLSWRDATAPPDALRLQLLLPATLPLRASGYPDTLTRQAQRIGPEHVRVTSQVSEVPEPHVQSSRPLATSSPIPEPHAAPRVEGTADSSSSDGDVPLPLRRLLNYYAVTRAPEGKQRKLGIWGHCTWKIVVESLALPATGLAGTGFHCKRFDSARDAEKYWVAEGWESPAPRRK